MSCKRTAPDELDLMWIPPAWAAPLSPIGLLEVQSFVGIRPPIPINHDPDGAIRRLAIAKFADSMPNPFATPNPFETEEPTVPDRPGTPAVAWFSPPCEHHAKGGK